MHPFVIQVPSHKKNLPVLQNNGAWTLRPRTQCLLHICCHWEVTWEKPSASGHSSLSGKGRLERSLLQYFSLSTSRVSMTSGVSAPPPPKQKRRQREVKTTNHAWAAAPDVRAAHSYKQLFGGEEAPPDEEHRADKANAFETSVYEPRSVWTE